MFVFSFVGCCGLFCVAFVVSCLFDCVGFVLFVFNYVLENVPNQTKQTNIKTHTTNKNNKTNSRKNVTVKEARCKVGSARQAGAAQRS